MNDYQDVPRGETITANGNTFRVPADTPPGRYSIRRSRATADDPWGYDLVNEHGWSAPLEIVDEP